MRKEKLILSLAVITTLVVSIAAMAIVKMPKETNKIDKNKTNIEVKTPKELPKLTEVDSKKDGELYDFLYGSLGYYGKIEQPKDEFIVALQKKNDPSKLYVSWYGIFTTSLPALGSEIVTIDIDKAQQDFVKESVKEFEKLDEAEKNKRFKETKDYNMFVLTSVLQEASRDESKPYYIDEYGYWNNISILKVLDNIATDKSKIEEVSEKRGFGMTIGKDRYATGLNFGKAFYDIEKTGWPTDWLRKENNQNLKNQELVNIFDEYWDSHKLGEHRVFKDKNGTTIDTIMTMRFTWSYMDGSSPMSLNDTEIDDRIKAGEWEEVK